jgi:hypothetical protein
MTTEYHKVVKSYDIEGNYQIFIFRYERDDVDKNTIGLIDLWIVTRLNGFESRVRIDIDGLSEKVYYHPEQQMSTEEVELLYNSFDDILDEEVKVQREVEKLENEVKLTVEQETQRLINAAECALSAHPINQSIEDIVKDIQNEVKDSTRYKS